MTSHGAAKAFVRDVFKRNLNASWEHLQRKIENDYLIPYQHSYALVVEVFTAIKRGSKAADKHAWLREVAKHELSGREARLAMVIFDFVNPELDIAWPSQETLGKRLGGIDPRQVRKAAQKLEDRGLIMIGGISELEPEIRAKIHRTGKGVYYALASTPAPQKKQSKPPKQLAEGKRKAADKRSIEGRSKRPAVDRLERPDIDRLKNEGTISNQLPAHAGSFSDFPTGVSFADDQSEEPAVNSHDLGDVRCGGYEREKENG